jgi:hypothetical protein
MIFSIFFDQRSTVRGQHIADGILGGATYEKLGFKVAIIHLRQ